MRDSGNQVGQAPNFRPACRTGQPAIAAGEREIEAPPTTIAPPDGARNLDESAECHALESRTTMNSLPSESAHGASARLVRVRRSAGPASAPLCARAGSAR